MPANPTGRLEDILELAAIERASWAPRLRSLRATGVPVNADDDEPTLLEQLTEKRNKKIDELATKLEAREGERAEFEKRDASDISDEDRSAFVAAEEAFKSEFNDRNAEIATLDVRIDEQELKERRRKEAANASRGEARVTAEPHTYRRDNADKQSYFRDLCYTDPKIAQSMRGNPTEAMDRLVRHSKESEEFLSRRAKDRERKAEEQIDRAEREFHRSHGRSARGFDASPFERRVNPNRTDGQGGYFVPPVWLIDEYIPALRAGRVAAGLARNMELPEGTDSINIPKLATPTRVGVQSADTAPVASQDFTDTAVTANVKTIAGQEDVAIQLVEQSPGQIIDQVIMEDLLADYNRVLDQQIIYGNGTNSQALNGGQLLGVYPQANWGANTVTWTTGSPLGNGFNMVMGAMASKTAYNRFNLQNFNFLLHPRRWFWFATALDGASGTVGRPLVNPRDTGFNVSAIEQANVPEQGLAGSSLFGPDVYIDANVPVTDALGVPGAGSADVAIGAIWDDLWLFEGNLRTRVLPEVLSGTLEIRFQAYNYVAFLARYGQSITLASGTGFAPPASAIDSSVTF